MLKINTEFLNNLLFRNSVPFEEEIDNEIRARAARINYLIGLLDYGYVTEEVLAVPEEEWEELENIIPVLFKMCEDNSGNQVVDFIHNNNTSYNIYNRLFNNLINIKPTSLEEDFI